MPLYEYQCKSCEQVFEYLQSFSARAKRKCEECGGKLDKLVSRSGFVLKGTGWYETDFKGGSKTDSASDSSEGSSASSDSSDSGKSKGSSSKKKGGSKGKKGGSSD